METPATLLRSTYQPASLTQRFLAFVLDALVLSLTFIPFVLVQIFNANSFVNGGYTNGLVLQASSMFVGMNPPSLVDIITYFTLSWASIFIPIIYYLLQDGLWQGRTPGRRVLDLMVIHLPSGKPCTRMQSAVRRGASLTFLAIPLGLIVDNILMLLDPAKRRPGDYYADTMVVSLAKYEQVKSLSQDAETTTEAIEPSLSPTPQLTPSYQSAPIHPAVLCLLGLIASLISQSISDQYYLQILLGVIESSTLVDLFLRPLAIAGACYGCVVFALLPLIPEGKARKWACIFALLTASASHLIESLSSLLLLN